jgi:molybdate transport system substrate-binding protein
MRRSVVSLTAPAILAAAGLLLTGCDASTTRASSTLPSASSSGAPAVSGTVNVFAAASLEGTFTKLSAQFEAAHPGTRVVLNFGPSSGLATQIAAGAPADVFASASTKNMDQVIKAGAAASPTDFASNVMEIAVPPDNPANVTQLSDLAKAAVKVALCQKAVPCGVTAAKVLTNASLTVTPVTQEVDVRAVLTKVSLGEVDAGVVYVTDVLAAGAKVKGIVIPADVNASTTYPIATLTKAPNKAAAQVFADYVLSADGASVLTSAGFAKP